ncbi:hypothetical protein PaG_04219 [Moesziomyces aphidis]|uniref:Uncharacterized protein n=1 Tax=Moesziomyces aphidis TaxID=84754 RepID=W3VLU7_MOEAP|nr:hypothetical protein PaG_04219 [Moesziomyces aphidis]
MPAHHASPTSVTALVYRGLLHTRAAAAAAAARLGLRARPRHAPLAERSEPPQRHLDGQPSSSFRFCSPSPLGLRMGAFLIQLRSTVGRMAPSQPFFRARQGSSPHLNPRVRRQFTSSSKESRRHLGADVPSDSSILSSNKHIFTMEKSKRDDVDALSSPSNPAHYFAYAASAFLITLSLPLLLFPRMLLLLSTPRGAVGQAASDADRSAVSAIGPELTPLERYASHTNALGMLAIAALILVLSGAIPVSTSPVPDASSSGKSPFRIPTVVISTVYFGLNAYSAWTFSGPNKPTGSIDPAALGIGTLGKVLGAAHAGFAFWGLAVFMFGNDLTRNSKKAGDASAKDKSVSNFPFKNQYAAEEKAKKSS